MGSELSAPAAARTKFVRGRQKPRQRKRGDVSMPRAEGPFQTDSDIAEVLD